MDLDWFWKCLFLQFISIANTTPIKYSFLRQLKTNEPNGAIRNFRFLKVETILLEKKKSVYVPTF